MLQPYSIPVTHALSFFNYCTYLIHNYLSILYFLYFYYSADIECIPMYTLYKILILFYKMQQKRKPTYLYI